MTAPDSRAAKLAATRKTPPKLILGVVHAGPGTVGPDGVLRPPAPPHRLTEPTPAPGG